MPDVPYVITHGLFKGPSEPLYVIPLHENDITLSILEDFLNNVDNSAIGISATYGPKGVLTVLSLAATSRVLRIKFSASSKSSKNPRSLLQNHILCHIGYKKLALDAERIVTALYFDHKILVTQVVDVQSMVPGLERRHAPSALVAALTRERGACKGEILKAFRERGPPNQIEQLVVFRAWATHRVSRVAKLKSDLKRAVLVDTLQLDKNHLQVLAKCTRDTDRLVAMKPTKVKNDVKLNVGKKSDNITLDQTRFKTRIRESDHQKVVIEIKGGSKIVGRASKVKGKLATIAASKAISSNVKLQAVYTIGREDPTVAEVDRTATILTALQGTNNTLSYPLMKSIFLCGGVRSTTLAAQQTNMTNPSIHFPDRPLNDSQRCAIASILSDDIPLSLIQGPPGTGKTTVIAAAVCSLIKNPNYRSRRTIWLVAQSNVAVKNIAEKLVNVGFLDFKLVVSFDFHFDWHEHLYHELERNVIRTDKLKGQDVDVNRLLLGSRVILCTLCTLSNPLLMENGFIATVPVDTIIVDEASQIEIGAYLSVFNKHGKHIRKIAFIGDDKQLAPYGQDELGVLQSIFEVKHLRRNALFLDTQYRMPHPIGGFISRHVYNNRLRTVHEITAKNSCQFVDIRQGCETAAGHSWKNQQEAHAVIKIVEQYKRQGKQFRVITPYDGQRSLIEEMLKSKNLPWEDKCFNVDSFQGNEEDYIILSVVRTAKIGFLSNLRRSNVMLSRCKKGMIICTNRNYLVGTASETLLGKFAKEWESSGWISWADILAGRFN